MSNQPNSVDETSGYRVYLDGAIVPWFKHADRVRGFVDVCAVNTSSYVRIGFSEVRLHRLFGVVTFEDRFSKL